MGEEEGGVDGVEAVRSRRMRIVRCPEEGCWHKTCIEI